MRDLDELLDSDVSRRATAATQKPDFAVIERRGRQRRRRARVMTVGAVATAVAVVGITGARVAQDNAAPDPVDRIQKFEGPNGELARAIRSGNAGVDGKVRSQDGSALLTTWSVTDALAVTTDGEPVQAGYGYTLRVDDDTTYWSTVYDDGLAVPNPIPVGGDAFAVARDVHIELVDPDGIRPLRVSEHPTKFADLDGDAIVPMWVERGTYMLLDSDAGMASPVEELDGVVPTCSGTTESAILTGDRDLWALQSKGLRHDIVWTRPDGTTTSYRFATQSAGTASSLVEYDGRVGVLWTAPGHDLRLSIPNRPSAKVTTYDYPDIYAGPNRPNAACAYGAAVLPDGRLLVYDYGDGTMVRTTDATWTHTESYPEPEALRKGAASGLSVVGDRLCTQTAEALGERPKVPDPVCSTDGMHWTAP